MYKLSSFHKNGIAYPLALKKKYSGVFLEKKYLEFKNKSVLKIGRPVVLKPHLLSNFFYKIAINIIKILFDKKLTILNTFIFLLLKSFIKGKGIINFKYK